MSSNKSKISTLHAWLEESGFSEEAGTLQLLTRNAQNLTDHLRFDNSSLPPIIPAHLATPAPAQVTGNNEVSPGGVDPEVAGSPQDLRLNELKRLYSDSEELAASAGSLEDRIMNQGFVLKSNDSSNIDRELIKEVQRELKEKGYNLGNPGANGLFTNETEAALIVFQASNYLPPTGSLDKNTLIKLRSDSSVRAKEEEGANETPRNSSSSPQPPALRDESGYPELVLANRNTPERTPQRVGSPNEVVFSKFSFEEVPCTNCAAMAIQESKDNWDNGNRLESHPDAEATLMEYWRYSSRYNSWSKNIDRWGFEGKRTYGPQQGKHQMNPVKERKMINGKNVATDWWAWSAVFTSFIMGHHDGEGAKWFISEAHSPYIAAYKKKRAEIEKDPDSHIGKMYYIWITKEELDRYGMKLQPGDLVGRPQHCDIYIGNNQMIGGNTCAQSEFTGGKRKNCKGTSGPQPVRWKSGTGVIKRVKITGPGSDRALVA